MLRLGPRPASPSPARSAPPSAPVEPAVSGGVTAEPAPLPPIAVNGARPAPSAPAWLGVSGVMRTLGIGAAAAMLGAGLVGAAGEARRAPNAPNTRRGVPVAELTQRTTPRPVAAPTAGGVELRLPPLPSAEHFLPAVPASVRSLRAVEPLDGGWVDGVGKRPQIHANDPEMITSVSGGRGIAISTLSPSGATTPAAHLDRSFTGPFRVFAHQQNRTGAAIQQLVLLYNPGSSPVTVRADALVSTTKGEAGYTDLSTPSTPQNAVRPDPSGTLSSGPGDRTALRVLRGEVEGPRQHVVPPGQAVIALRSTVPSGEEITTHGELESSGPVQLAVLYTADSPSAATALARVRGGSLLPKSSQWDRTPTPPGQGGAFVYGRVAGVAPRSTFLGRLSNDTEHRRFLAAAPGVSSWALNTKTTQQLGSGRDDAAPLDARYPTSAYANHANYGAELRVATELHNPSAAPRRIRLYIDNPSQGRALSRAMRQSLEVRLGPAGEGPATVQRFHASLAPGVQSATPIADVELAPGESRSLELRMFYASNNTAPQVLRMEVTGPAAVD